MHLLLQNNELCALPDTLGCLSALSNLNLAHNRLVELPATMALLPRIEVLDLSANRLTSLPAEARNGWGTLRELELRGNQLAGLPAVTSKDPTAGWPLLVY